MASGSFNLSRTGSTSSYITFTCNWSSEKNVAANTSTVNVTIVASKSSSSTSNTWGSYTASATVNGSSQSVGSTSFTLATGKSITLLSKSYTVPHNSDGTKSTTISATVGGNVMYGNGSASITLDTIPRGSTLGTISNFTLGNSINIPITKHASSFTDTLTISLNGTTIKTVNNITDGYDVSFTQSELNTIYKLLPSSPSGTFTFKLTTKSGSTQIGTSTKTATGTIPSSIKPTISSVTISEANTEVMPSDLGVYVQNKSKLNFVISASAGTGSSIASITTTINGSIYSGSDITTNIIDTFGDLKALIVVSDKRGRTTNLTKTISVENYADPYITTFNAFRCDKDGNASDKGNCLYVSLKGGVSSLNGKNTASYSIQYKKTNVTEYTTYSFEETSSTIDSYAIIKDISTSSSYNVKAVISDLFISLSKASTPISSVFRTIHYKAGGRAVAIGKMAEDENTFEVALQTKLTGGLTPIFLQAEIDLNEVKIPNFYTGENISNANYLNCPLTSGTFDLEVKSCGDEGQVKQIITSCSKTGSITYERYFYQDTWGDWKPSVSNALLVTQDSTNLNDYTSSGMFYFTSSKTPLNVPSGVANGYLVVIALSETTVKQLWYRGGTANKTDFMTYVRTCIEGSWSKWQRYSTDPVVLYEGSEAGTVTLSDDINNYSYLEVLFSDNNGKYGGYTKVPVVGWFDLCLSITEPSSSTSTYMRYTRYAVTGNTMTPFEDSSGYISATSGVIKNHVFGYNHIRILKVLGHV